MEEEEKKRIRLEEFEEGEENIIEAEIEEMDVLSAEELFGEKAYDAERSILRLWIKGSKVRAILSLPKGLEFDAGEFYVTDPIAFRRSTKNPASGFGKFLKKYGIPEIGTKIKLEFVDDTRIGIVY